MNAMAFFLVRAGLPNSIALLALAIVPIVALAVAALPTHHDVARYQSPSVTLVAGIDAAADFAQPIAE
jgi:hypothetical protein